MVPSDGRHSQKGQIFPLILRFPLYSPHTTYIYASLFAAVFVTSPPVQRLLSTVAPPPNILITIQLSALLPVCVFRVGGPSLPFLLYSAPSSLMLPNQSYHFFNFKQAVLSRASPLLHSSTSKCHKNLRQKKGGSKSKQIGVVTWLGGKVLASRRI